MYKRIFNNYHLQRLKKRFNIDIKKPLSDLVSNKGSSKADFTKIYSRNCNITKEMIGFGFSIYNGIKYYSLIITVEMVGKKFGEFSFTKHKKRSIHIWNKAYFKLLKTQKEIKDKKNKKKIKTLKKKVIKKKNG